MLRALAAPTLGHLDPQYLAILDETCEMLRQIFQTKNALTFPVSGTGMAGMECVAVNLIEPGDEVIVCVNGVFGGRMKDVMERCGATVHAIEVPWGDVFSRTSKSPLRWSSIRRANSSASSMRKPAPARTSRSKDWQNWRTRGTRCSSSDAVTSLGGHELRVDDWEIDAIYSGTQENA